MNGKITTDELYKEMKGEFNFLFAFIITFLIILAVLTTLDFHDTNNQIKTNAKKLDKIEKMLYKIEREKL